MGTDFQHYYSEFPHHEFATMVWVNNAWVAAQCIAFGVLGLPVLFVLVQNVMGLGVVAALMMSHGRTALFFGLILPHGLLELTAVFVAGGVGLRLFWSWVDPGPRPRLQALAAEARTAVGMTLGLAVVLLVSGTIEGFVTPSGLPTWARIGIGLVAESGVLRLCLRRRPAGAPRGSQRRPQRPRRRGRPAARGVTRGAALRADPGASA